MITTTIHTPPEDCSDPVAWVNALVARLITPQIGDGSCVTLRHVHQRSPEWRQRWGGEYVPARTYSVLHGLPLDVDPQTFCEASQRAAQAITTEHAAAWHREACEAAKRGPVVAVLDVVVSMPVRRAS